MRTSLWLVPLAGLGALAVNDPANFEDGSDLESFVTRPDIRAPRMMVVKHKPESISDGYWFTMPYSHFDGISKTNRREFTPCQTGAHIYDGDGNLVWSGACWGGNRNIFSFEPVTFDGQQYLKMYLSGRELGINVPFQERLASGVIIDQHYREVSRTTLHGGEILDFHEFNVMPDGKSALVTTTRTTRKDAPEVGQNSRRIFNMGFQEVGVDSGIPSFSWDPLEHGVLLNESYDAVGKNLVSNYWDFLHINSVDKSPKGDYFVSGRHTSTIYKVSGEDGHIVWRLGGHASDFVMEDGLEFFWQHHIRFQYENETTTIISLFDNACEDEHRNPSIEPSTSSGKIIALDTSVSPMTARILRRFDRPDGGQTTKLGSVQILGDNIEKDNVFIDWALQGYLSEHDAEGNCVLEARFQSDRMMSYRAHKYNWVGQPAEPPVLKVVPTSFAENKLVSAFYVSWNGATEVASWRFYGGAESNATLRKLGSATKMGFETSWISSEVVLYAYAEAIDKNGSVVGRTATQSIHPPSDGDYTGASTLVAAAEAQEVPEEPGVELEWLSAIVVNLFALWGLYCIVRKCIPRDFPRRKGGYRVVPEEIA